MIFVIDFLALLEIWWDWRLIERKQRSPNYRGSNWLRFVVGFVVWISWPLMVEVSHENQFGLNVEELVVCSAILNNALSVIDLLNFN